MANMIPRQTFWIDEAEADIKPIYCRLRSITKDRYGRRGHTLRNWRLRNRLFMTAEDGTIYRVPASMGTSSMLRYMARGRLFLLTNGIY